MNKIIDNIKSGNYEVVDNQGVSVTGHFTQCLEKEFADLEAKLAEKDKEIKQNKISFTIEQLEKVKKEFNERKLEYITMETKTHIYGLRIDRINELIDNQINELKEMK